ncbi:MAG: glycosyltransferase family 9 protein [Dermatophilaceae bacterium]|nr:glycosyltransferase family 9 protein [Dermatophilaceae bacterium]
MAVTRRALVLRALGLGDLLTAVPALRALRQGLAAYEIVLAADKGIGELLRLEGLVDRVLPARGLTPLEWGGRPPDVAVNLHGRGPESHRVLQALEPYRLVGFRCPEVGSDGPEWRPGEHEVHRWCRLVRCAGWPADPTRLRLTAQSAVPSPAPGAVVVHPGAAYASRRWPAERFAAVAAAVAEDGHQVVVTGSPDERRLARHVARTAGLPSAAVLAGRTDVRGLSALVAEAGLVVCGDTGVAHLATAHRTPSVVLFGPVPPTEWGPTAAGPHTVLWHGQERAAVGGRGDPFGRDLDPALAAVTVEEVVDAVRDRLRHRPSHMRRRGSQAPSADSSDVSAVR